MEKLRTISEISQLLEVPESTLRYRAKLFTEFLPTRGAHRKKRFLPLCVERFALIDQLFSSGLIAEDISDALRERFPAETDESEVAVVVPARHDGVVERGVGEVSEFLKPMLRVIESQEVIISELQEQNRELTRRLRAAEQ